MSRSRKRTARRDLFPCLDPARPSVRGVFVLFFVWPLRAPCRGPHASLLTPLVFASTRPYAQPRRFRAALASCCSWSGPKHDGTVLVTLPMKLGCLSVDECSAGVLPLVVDAPQKSEANVLGTIRIPLGQGTVFRADNHVMGSLIRLADASSRGNCQSRRKQSVKAQESPIAQRVTLRTWPAAGIGATERRECMRRQPLGCPARP